MKPLPIVISICLLCVSSSHAQFWKKVDGIPSQAVYSVNAGASAIFAGTVDRLYIAGPDGLVWRATTPIAQNAVVLTAVQYHQTLFAGTMNAGVWISKDEGDSWQFQDEGLQGISVSQFAIWNDRLYAATLGIGFFVYDETGHRWLPFNQEFAVSVSGVVNDLIATDTALVAATAGNGISYILGMQTNGWQESLYFGILRPGLSGESLLQDKHGDLYAAVTGSRSLLKTTDNGRTWMADNNGLPFGDGQLTQDNLFDYFIVSYPDALTGIPRLETYRRLQGQPVGAGWQIVDSTKQDFCFDAVFGGGKLYAARNNGLFYHFEYGMDASAYSVYPNPAGRSVSIALGSEIHGPLSVRLLDASGRVAAVPLSNYTPIAGQLSVSFNLYGLATGVYYVDIMVDGHHYSRPLLVSSSN